MQLQGHFYFSLKDNAAQVRCVMFRSRAQLLGWRLENGQQIEARVLVTLYEARGDFQLNVEAARRGGVGNLYEQFLRLQGQDSQREGLFDSAGEAPFAGVSAPRRHRHLSRRRRRCATS
jgi:exodeoxyribonuclease VII large subunit